MIICPHCHSPDVFVEDGGPRNIWRGYTYCAACDATLGSKWRRMIDEFCEREWGFRPNNTRPAKAMSARQGQDRNGLGATPASAVANGDLPILPHDRKDSKKGVSHG